ncbi:MAG: hypothetical protein ABF737_07465, partial [Oenococcus sicerae]
PLLVLLLINMIFQYILVHNQKISDFIKANLKSKLIVTFVACLFMLATGTIRLHIKGNRLSG